MFELFLALAFFLVAIFGVVVLFGAPYLPTFNEQSEKALAMLDLKRGDCMIELGCGDGRVMLMALKQGYCVVGYELNPLLAFVSWLRTRKYKNKARVVWGSFWSKDWPQSQGLYVFLHTKFMKRLDKKINEQIGLWRLEDEARETKSSSLSVVSYVFEIPGKPIAKKQGAIIKYIYRY